LSRLAATVRLSTKTLNLRFTNGVYKPSLIDLETRKRATGAKRKQAERLSERGQAKKACHAIV